MSYIEIYKAKGEKCFNIGKFIIIVILTHTYKEYQWTAVVSLSLCAYTFDPIDYIMHL
jgi:hypothetical protein